MAGLIQQDHYIETPLTKISDLEKRVAELQRLVALLAGGGSGADHGGLAGLADDDHTQYVLASGARAFTGVVSGVTPTSSAHFATKGYVDGEVVDDHGALSGLGDDDHSQYSLVSGARAFTGTVSGVTPTASTHLVTKGYVDSVASGVPSGIILPYGGASAPSGYLLCDGSAVSRSTYSTLFAIIGEGFGPGDGSTTFNLPDLCGRFPVGAESSTDHELGDTGGEETHTLVTGELPSHTHTVDPPSTNTSSDGAHNHALTLAGFGATSTYLAGGVGKIGSSTTMIAAASNHYHTVNIASFTSGSAGSGAAHENRPPFLGVSFIIKT